MKNQAEEIFFSKNQGRFMIEILGKTYVTDKELAKKYGFSLSWFRNQRYKKTGLPYVKITGQAKILYDVKVADEWFSNNISLCEY